MKNILLLMIMISIGIHSLQAKEKSQVTSDTLNVMNGFAKKQLSDLNYQDRIVYKIIDGDTLDLILILPKNKPLGELPFVLYTHGGGWGGGHKYVFTQGNSMGAVRKLLDNGIAFASVQYRLTREGKSTAYDCVVDCKDAARFLMKNATRYGLDPKRIAVWGGSAGGHISLMTGIGANASFKGDPALSAFSPTFKGILSYFPLTTFLVPEVLKGSNFENPRRMIPMFGGKIEDHMDMAKLLSPAEQLTKNSPPIYLIHGDNDIVLSISNSIYLKKIGDERGANVHLTVVKGGGHGFKNGISPTQDEINAEAAAFLIKCLKP